MNFLAYSTDIPVDVGGKFGYGLSVTAIGMLIVFAVLILIMLVIYLFQLVFYTIPKKKAAGKKENPEAPVPAPVSVSPSSVAGKPEELVAAIAAATAMVEEELIVVLAAAVAAQEGGDVVSSRYRIRSFRRIL